MQTLSRKKYFKTFFWMKFLFRLFEEEKNSFYYHFFTCLSSEERMLDIFSHIITVFFFPILRAEFLWRHFSCPSQVLSRNKTKDGNVMFFSKHPSLSMLLNILFSATKLIQETVTTIPQKEFVNHIMFIG